MLSRNMPMLRFRFSNFVSGRFSPFVLRIKDGVARPLLAAHSISAGCRDGDWNPYLAYTVN